MGCSRLIPIAVAAAACAHHGPAATTLTLRDACAEGRRWDGAACVARTAAAALAASAEATKAADMDAALAALDQAAREPLDLASHVRLWQARGEVRSYIAHDDPTPAKEEAVRAAFDRLLAIAPDYQLDCQLSEQTTDRFGPIRAALAERAPRELEVTWPRDRKVGQPVLVDLETVADPVGVLATATLYVRQRGATAWQAAEVPLPPPGQRRRVKLPAITATEATGVEIYAIAHDPDGNDTLAWASPRRPRDIPLRYDPPTPWHRTWWVWAIAGGVVAVGAGVTTYALTWSPSDTIGGTVETR
ncbi:MAG: hypothetical protein IPL61_33640 [Myxococcales bacterium]|nr:hypothetical protein [Myxococcales bacterium]